MITKYDITDIDKNSLPEEVLHEINEYEGMGRELVSIERYDFPADDEINEQIWEIVFYEPFFSFEASDFDSFSFVRVSYQKWPTNKVYTFYSKLTRGDMKKVLEYESAGQREATA